LVMLKDTMGQEYMVANGRQIPVELTAL